MKKIVYTLLLLSFAFTKMIYKEIKLDNIPNSTMPYINSLGIDLDHIHKADDFIQFVISEYDLNKLDLFNVEYEIIHLMTCISRVKS